MTLRQGILNFHDFKRCCRCETAKPLSGFGKRREGKAPWCLECSRRYDRARHKKKMGNNKQWRMDYYRGNRSKAIAYSKKHKKLTRERLLSGYGSICACCGETRKTMLELDHIFNDGREDRKNKNNGQIYLKAIRDGFPTDRYQLLCCNCNQSKRRNGGLCQHYTDKWDKWIDFDCHPYPYPYAKKAAFQMDP